MGPGSNPGGATLTRLLYVAFFLSGLAGLVYEIVWSRYLALFVGHSAYAQVIVLTIFLGGLSVGSLAVARVSERVRRPLLVYAGVELAVGLLGIFFHEIFTLLTDAVYGGAAGGGGAGVRWLVAGVMIFPQSVLLGTTFPLMSAALLRRDPGRPGRTLALLYFVNSLGAALGALLAGFVLVALVGLPGAVAVAGSLNLLVAGLSWLVGRWTEPGPATAPVAPPPPGEADAPGDRRLWTVLLGVAFGTAVASFVYEIAWIRMLSLVLGSATHSFEIMLSAFILGIALGALWIERRADRLADPVGTLAAIQWAMGFAALATLPLYVASFSWTAALVTAIPETAAGYRIFNLARYGVALAVMLPSTVCAGMTLPLLTRILVVRGRGERAVGWVYGVNTLGSIVGVGAAALVLLPLLGLELLLLLGAGLDMVLGVGLLHLGAARLGDIPRVRRLAWGTTAVVLLAVGTATELDPLLLTGGVYRTGRVPGTGAEVLFYEDGRTATVSVVETEEWRTIATNGKTDASVRAAAYRSAHGDALPRGFRGDEPTQLLLGLLPLAYHPEPRRVAVIGQGSGLTSHHLLADARVREVATIEIEPEMIEGSRAFHPVNRRVFEDPRSRFVVDDARAVLLRARTPFDVVVSEPSNPWVSGVSSLFTAEFYRHVRQRLAPDGILVQWLQVYELSDELILSVLAALHRSFPSYHVYQSTGDLLVVAGTDLPEPDWSVLELPGMEVDLRRIENLAPAHLTILRVADRRLLAPLLDGRAVVNSDFHPVLDLGAEQARFIGDWASDLLFLGSGPLHVASPYLPPSRRLAPGPAPFPEIQRVTGLALNTAARQALAGTPVAELPGGDELARRVDELRSFHSAMEARRPPEDWMRWAREAQRVIGYHHDGFRGVADRGFFEEVAAYLEAVEAPEPVWAAMDFSRDAHAWDFRGAVASGRYLLVEATEGRDWVGTDLLMDGLVTASLQSGEIELARHALRLLRPRSRRGPDDIRIRLLEAHLAEAGAHGS